MRALNIIFIGDYNFGTRTLYRLETLKKLGHNIFPIPTNKIPFIGGIDKLSILERIINRLKLNLDFLKINKNIINAVSDNTDLIWIEKGLNIYPWTFKKILKINNKAKIISLSEDDMFRIHNISIWYLLALKYYHFVFTSKKYNIKELQKLGAKKVILFINSYYEKVHRPLKNMPKKYEVSFVGTYEKERSEYIYFLAQNNIVINVFGSDWTKMKLKHKNIILNKPLYDYEYSKILNQTLINLCFLRKINRDTITTRSIEIPACGSFMMAEESADHKDFFVNNKEAVFFSSKEDLLGKIKYYLKNKNDALKIGNNARNRCIASRYSLTNVLEDIITKVVI